MRIFSALAAVSFLAASFGMWASFPAPALSGEAVESAGICADPYISKQEARGRAHWYLIGRGFQRTADGKPRVIMGDAKCEEGFWRVKVVLIDYKPAQKRQEIILINANSGNVIRNISIIS